METNCIGYKMNFSAVQSNPERVIAICTAIFLLGLLIISTIILASVPPVSRDALVHHLAVPKLYLKHGGIYEIPSMSFSYYPMNLDLLYLIPLYFGNDIIPKFIHFCFALLTAGIIFNYLRRRQAKIYALYGVVFFLSIPIIVKLSITVYVDLGLTFFSTVSVISLLRWIESNYRLRFLIISAVSCGLAMGTKYNGLIVFFLLSLFIPFISSRYAKDCGPGFLNSAGRGLMFAFIALAVFSPWMIKNYIWTNNPVYPLYNQWFNPQDPVAGSPLSLFEVRNYIYNESWWQMILLPLRVFFQGQDGSPQYFDGRLNPFLLLLPAVGFLKSKKDPQPIRVEKKILLGFAVLFFSFAFFGSGIRIRYFCPMIPPLVILSAFGIEKITDLFREFGSPKLQNVGWAIFPLIIFSSLGLNAAYIPSQYSYVKPFEYVTGTLTRDEYIEKHRPEYSAMKYIRRHLPEDANIMFIFMGNRGYYCDRKYIFDIHNNRSRLQHLVKNTGDFERVSLGLRDLGVTHLLIYHGVFDKWVKTGFSLEDQGVIGKFFERKSRLLFFQSGYGLYELSLQPCV